MVSGNTIQPSTVVFGGLGMYNRIRNSPQPAATNVPQGRLSVLKRVVALNIGGVYLLPRRQEKDRRKVRVLRKPRVQLTLVQGREPVERAERVKDAAIKEDRARCRSVTVIVVDVFA